MALAEHSIDQTIDFIQSDSNFKLYDDRSKINGNDKRLDFKHGNPNVFMANLDYAAAARASRGGKRLLCRALCVVGPLTDGDGGVLRRCWRTPGRWPSFKEGQNVLDFGASRLARRGDWRWCKKAVDGGHPCR